MPMAATKRDYYEVLGVERTATEVELKASFRKLAMQPGMPQGFGMVGTPGTPIFTLPGNPVSAYV